MQTATALPATNPVPLPARNVSRTSPPSPSISSLDTPDSTWISRVTFIRTPRAAGDRRFLAFYVRDSSRVLLYSDGPRRKLPLSLRDVFTGTLAAHCSLSIGQAYNRLVRGNPAYRYQSVGRAELDAVLATI